VTSSPATRPEPDLTRRLERAAAWAWPATVTQLTGGGWLLRATPGLDRARSNNALTPCRPLDGAEIEPALREVEAFARRHGVTPGIQVSPLELHATLQGELDRRGWGRRWPVLVLVAPVDGALSGADAGIEVSDRATEEWLSAWARCEPGRDVEAHARTVLRLLAGRATFARLGEAAVGIAVERDDLVGLYCVAVEPERRRAGLGTAIVRALLARSGARTAYLQVEESNAPAIAMYARLGFTEAYSYCHRVFPE
jgi:N-acetylglutamate synthase